MSDETPAAPTPPLPHAAPAPAAEAGVGERLTLADARQRAMDQLASAEAARAAAREAEARFESADAELGRTYAELDAALLRAEAAEAERDRLSAELAALRGAMPDAALLDYAAGQLSVASRNVHIASSTADQYRDTEESLSRAAAAIRAALATATATPQAAGAGTGVDDDTRRLAWLATELAYDWTIGEIDIAELACAYASDAGREDEDPIADDVIAALRRAIDTMMSLDRPQEADHAAQ